MKKETQEEKKTLALKIWERKKLEKKLYNSQKKAEEREKKKVLGEPLNNPEKAKSAVKKQREGKVKIEIFLTPEQKKQFKELVKSKGFTSYSEFIEYITINFA